ncbi:hypothetical protein Adt_43031 [Abeliophyllum distichum]|uniref:Uncharacterized protein n=1 Tax=Abeliophyllum distichum TaxID=126358 RepID=A0ABD1PTC8_9LAMI
MLRVDLMEARFLTYRSVGSGWSGQQHGGDIERRKISITIVAITCGCGGGGGGGGGGGSGGVDRVSGACVVVVGAMGGRFGRIFYVEGAIPRAKIRAFEAIPTLGQQFAYRLEGDKIPRMRVQGKAHISSFTKSAEEEFCQGMTPLDDVEDSIVDNSLNEDRVEESEENEPPVSIHRLPCDRPSSSHNNNVLEIDRQEIRELESRLIHVINGRCDHIETKLNRLLKLVKSGVSQPQRGEFQPDRGGFQSEMKGFDIYSPHRKDNVPEENKEREKDCVFEAAVDNSINVEDCTYKEEQVTPIQGEEPRSATGQGWLFGRDFIFLVP